jgi:hypothetical protein
MGNRKRARVHAECSSRPMISRESKPPEWESTARTSGANIPIHAPCAQSRRECVPTRSIRREHGSGESKVRGIRLLHRFVIAVHNGSLQQGTEYFLIHVG